MSDGAKARRGIQSVVTGLRVLSAVAGNREPASLSSIAKASGLSASQAHRYLSSLIEAGMVRQEERLGLYDLDAGAIRIGLSALTRMDVFRLSDDVLPQMAKECSHTCLVTVWGDNGPTVVRWHPGDPPVTTSINIGSVLPLLTSATGAVFYAFADKDLTRAKAEEQCALMNWKPSDFHDLREQTRRSLVATVRGKVIPGLRAMACPVFDVQGRLAIGVTLIAGDGVPRSTDANARKCLVKSCRELTEALGGQWPSSSLAD